MAIKWNDEFYVQCYQLSKAGQRNDEIASSLGTDKKTFKKWLSDHPALGVGIRAGRSKDLGLQHKWIYGKLSEKSQACWQRIMKAEKEKNAVRKIELLFNKYGDGIRKEIFLHCLAGSSFNPSTACRRVNIPYSQFTRWVEEDFEFEKLVLEMEQHKDNLYEEMFLEAATKDKEPALLLHAAKTRLRNKGYGEKLEIHHSGEIKNTGVFEIGDKLLELLDTHSKRQVMAAMQKLQLDQENSERKLVTVDAGV